MHHRSDTGTGAKNNAGIYKVSMILAGLIVGIIAGTILLFLSYIAPYIGAGNFLKETKNSRIGGKRISQREGQYIGILVHLMSAAFFGMLYAAAVAFGVVSDFSFIHLLGWSGVMTLVIGGIILPLEGHGLFGVKEDAWFPLDLYITNFLWCILYWWLIPSWLSVIAVS